MEIKDDLYRYGGLVGFKGFVKAWFIPGFRFTYFFRKAQSHKNNMIMRYFYKIILRHYSFKYGFQIPVSAKVGKGLYIGHFGTIVISGYAKLGKNCNLSHLVTIGRANRGELKGSPEIGDSVWIGTNSVIVGNIKIGSNVLIAPCSYINFDVPDNSVVIGNQIKPKINATEGYINYKVK
jgi:serine O-acetyltransferase